mmetsp:Transcript_17082/g.37651  ORF Transcript_17082/g.37651 Transcript_17082/m.37651 type:complete len:410 (-) Transcript_17082:1314-2543(-)
MRHPQDSPRVHALGVGASHQIQCTNHQVAGGCRVHLITIGQCKRDLPGIDDGHLVFPVCLPIHWGSVVCELDPVASGQTVRVPGGDGGHVVGYGGPSNGKQSVSGDHLRIGHTHHDAVVAWQQRSCKPGIGGQQDLLVHERHARPGRLVIHPTAPVGWRRLAVGLAPLARGAGRLVHGAHHAAHAQQSVVDLGARVAGQAASGAEDHEPIGDGGGVAGLGEDGVGDVLAGDCVLDLGRCGVIIRRIKIQLVSLVVEQGGTSDSKHIPRCQVPPLIQSIVQVRQAEFQLEPVPGGFCAGNGDDVPQAAGLSVHRGLQVGVEGICVRQIHVVQLGYHGTCAHNTAVRLCGPIPHCELVDIHTPSIFALSLRRGTVRIERQPRARQPVLQASAQRAAGDVDHVIVPLRAAVI